MPAARAKLSVVVLAKDEAPYIQRCVRSAAPVADEVVVLDSGSTDGTQDLARAAGARVEHQDWLGYAAQRNAAADRATHDWIFQLDADEVITRELADSIQRLLAAGPDPRAGYTVQRRNDFLGTLLPQESRASRQRAFVRLYHRGASGYDPAELVHEEVRVPGPTTPLDGLLLHWRGETIDHIAAGFNRYATLEAEQLAQAGVRATQGLILGRSVLRFLWVYVWKRAFRLGPRGLIYAMLKAYSEYLRYAKLWERQTAPERRIHPPRRGDAA